MNDPLRHAKEYKGAMIAPRMGRFDIWVLDRADYMPITGYWNSEAEAKKFIDDNPELQHLED